MRTGTMTLLGIVAIGMAGCSSSEPTKSSTSPTPSAESEQTSPTFDTAAALMDALRAKGLPCTGFRNISTDLYDTRALQAASCTTPDLSELNVSIYANSSDAETAPQRKFDSFAQSHYGSYMVVGNKWCVAVSEKGAGWLPKVQQAVGGKLVTIPKVE